MNDLKYFVYCCCLLFATAQTVARSTSRKGVLSNEKTEWSGPWFPHAPGETTALPLHVNEDNASEALKHAHGNKCDDGVHFIGVDFAPDIQSDSYHNLCITANLSKFMPNMNTQPVLIDHFIPPAYVAPVKCLNESIGYSDTFPTYGSFRPVAPKYGSYKYLPPQRWLNSLARGAIVMLYHPCAFSGQVDLLQNTLRSCLYRHIISPSILLSPERPLVLLAWGKSLEMSVVDDKIAVTFIKDHAKKGPLANISPSKKDIYSYETGLLTEAHLITDIDDTEICGYKQM